MHIVYKRGCVFKFYTCNLSPTQMSQLDRLSPTSNGLNMTFESDDLTIYWYQYVLDGLTHTRYKDS